MSVPWWRQRDLDTRAWWGDRGRPDISCVRYARSVMIAAAGAAARIAPSLLSQAMRIARDERGAGVGDSPLWTVAPLRVLGGIVGHCFDLAITSTSSSSSSSLRRRAARARRGVRGSRPVVRSVVQAVGLREQVHEHAFYSRDARRRAPRFARRERERSSRFVAVARGRKTRRTVERGAQKLCPRRAAATLEGGGVMCRPRPRSRGANGTSPCRRVVLSRARVAERCARCAAATAGARRPRARPRRVQCGQVRLERGDACRLGGAPRAPDAPRRGSPRRAAAAWELQLGFGVGCVKSPKT